MIKAKSNYRNRQGEFLELISGALSALTGISREELLADNERFRKLVEKYKKLIPWPRLAQQANLSAWLLYHWYFDTYQRQSQEPITPEDQVQILTAMRVALEHQQPLDRFCQRHIKGGLSKDYDKMVFAIFFNNARRKVMREFWLAHNPPTEEDIQKERDEKVYLRTGYYPDRVILKLRKKPAPKPRVKPAPKKKIAKLPKPPKLTVPKLPSLLPVLQLPVSLIPPQLSVPRPPPQLKVPKLPWQLPQAPQFPLQLRIPQLPQIPATSQQQETQETNHSSAQMEMLADYIMHPENLMQFSQYCFSQTEYSARENLLRIVPFSEATRDESQQQMQVYQYSNGFFYEE